MIIGSLGSSFGPQRRLCSQMQTLNWDAAKGNVGAVLTHLLNSGSLPRSNKAECVVIVEGLNSDISSSIRRPIRLAAKSVKETHNVRAISNATCFSVLDHWPTVPLTAESRSTVGGDVQQRLGQDSALLVTLDEDVALPFGQLGAVLVHEQRKVSEGGRPPAQSAVHQQVFGRWNEPLGPSQDVADLHMVVVHNVGKVVCGESICFHHHGVTFHLHRWEEWKLVNCFFLCVYLHENKEHIKEAVCKPVFCF